jgi:hypothetical protein
MGDWLFKMKDSYKWNVGRSGNPGIEIWMFGSGGLEKPGVLVLIQLGTEVVKTAIGPRSVSSRAARKKGSLDFMTGALEAEWR